MAEAAPRATQFSDPEHSPAPVQEAEETIALVLQAARENGWSERDALIWVTSPSTYFPGPGHLPVDHLDKPEYVAEMARNRFGVIW